jgi:hypothetical protein
MLKLGSARFTGNERIQEYCETDQLIPLWIENDLSPAGMDRQNTCSRLVSALSLFPVFDPAESVPA